MIGRRQGVADEVQFRGRRSDVGKFIGRKLDFHASEIFFEPPQLRRSGDRHDSGFLGQQPTYCDLRRRGGLARCNITNQVDEHHVRFARLG